MVLELHLRSLSGRKPTQVSVCSSHAPPRSRHISISIKVLTGRKARMAATTGPIITIRRFRFISISSVKGFGTKMSADRRTLMHARISESRSEH